MRRTAVGRWPRRGSDLGLRADSNEVISPRDSVLGKRFRRKSFGFHFANGLIVFWPSVACLKKARRHAKPSENNKPALPIERPKLK